MEVDRNKWRLLFKRRLLGQMSLIARFMGPAWAHLGPTGPRWAPCWPHEFCYLGYYSVALDMMQSQCQVHPSTVTCYRGIQSRCRKIEKKNVQGISRMVRNQITAVNYILILIVGFVRLGIWIYMVITSPFNLCICFIEGSCVHRSLDLVEMIQVCVRLKWMDIGGKIVATLLSPAVLPQSAESLLVALIGKVAYATYISTFCNPPWKLCVTKQYCDCDCDF